MVLCVFETSSKTPRYGSLATLPDGPGGVRQITWGYHQGTDASNTVDEILEAFVAEPGDATNLAAQAAAVLPKFRSNNPTIMRRLADDGAVKQLLRDIAKTPAGQAAQRSVFQRRYMEPAIHAWLGSGWRTTLALVTVVDGMTHGSWGRIRDLVSPKLNEQHWIESYLLRRAAWLHGRGLPLSNTACRPEALLRLARQGNWNLDTPFTLDMGHRGKVTITADDIAAMQV